MWSATKDLTMFLVFGFVTGFLGSCSNAKDNQPPALTFEQQVHTKLAGDWFNRFNEINFPRELGPAPDITIDANHHKITLLNPSAGSVKVANGEAILLRQLTVGHYELLNLKKSRGDEPNKEFIQGTIRVTISKSSCVGVKNIAKTFEYPFSYSEPGSDIDETLFWGNATPEFPVVFMARERQPNGTDKSAIVKAIDIGCFLDDGQFVSSDAKPIGQ